MGTDKLWENNRMNFRIDPWLWGAFLVAISIRLIRLDEAALWLDETFTATWLRLPWGEMVRTVLADNHLPLYFVIVKAWTFIAGVSPWALRLPSVLCSWAIVPLTAGIGEIVSGRRTARWAAWFAALSPYLLQHAQDARMYALLGALAAANTLLLGRFLTGQSQKLGGAFFLVNFALLATHYYGVIFVGAEVLAVIALAPGRWRSWVTAAVASCLLVLGPLLCAKLLATSNAGGSYEMGLLALPGLVWSLISGYTLLPSSAELHAQGVRSVIAYLPIAIPSLVAVLILVGATVRFMSTKALLLLTILIGVVVLGPFAVGLLFPVGINPRYAMAGVPALLVLLAAGSPVATGQRVRAAAAAVLMVVMLIASTLQLADPGHGRENVYAVGKWLDVNVPKEEEILVASEEMAILARFHWPDRRFRLYPPRGVIVGRANADQVADDLPLSHPTRTIYLYGREWLYDPDGELLTALKNRHDACPGTEVRGIRVLCFIPHHG